jgi:predicted small secreted protein
MKKTGFLLLTLSLATLALGACTNTFQGAGEDMQNAGEWMQDQF